MATLKDAEQARDEAAEQLRGLGAHAISVEEEPADDPEPDADRSDADRSTGATGSTAAAGTVEHLEGSKDDLAGGSRRRRRRSFAVVAWFADGPPADLPQTLEVRAGTRTKVVPLRARRAEQFRAE